MPANTPVLSLPYPLPADTVDVPRDIQALADRLDIVAVPAIVTTLPGAPTDGQECYYVADATNGNIWHLKYRAADPSAYKWQFVGGSSLQPGPPSGSTSTTSTAYVPLAGGPTLTLALAGDYEILWTAQGQLMSAGGCGMNLALYVNGVSVGSVSQIAGVQFGGGQYGITSRVNSIPAGAALALQVQNSAALTVNYTNGLIIAKPIRVA